jgi:hypothetical protein
MIVSDHELEEKKIGREMGLGNVIEGLLQGLVRPHRTCADLMFEGLLQGLVRPHRTCAELIFEHTTR